MSEQLFTEAQWRAAAKVEARTWVYGRDFDGFAWWSERKRLSGPTFTAGEFYVGCRPGGTDFRVYEFVSGLIFASGESMGEVIGAARDCINAIGAEHMPRLLAVNAERYESTRIEIGERMAEQAARTAITKARKPAPKKISKRAQAVFAASEGKCHYCGAALTLDGKWHIEHKMPRALFGGSEQDNLAAACIPCNIAKRDKTDLEFIAMREARA